MPYTIGNIFVCVNSLFLIAALLVKLWYWVWKIFYCHQYYTITSTLVVVLHHNTSRIAQPCCSCLCMQRKKRAKMALKSRSSAWIQQPNIHPLALFFSLGQTLFWCKHVFEASQSQVEHKSI